MNMTTVSAKTMLCVEMKNSHMLTTQCVSVVTETVNHSVHNKSDVYMCMIDTSKAFDKVDYLLVFFS